MVYTVRYFSSKCSLFHNSNVFGSCIIHILYTGCAKTKKKTISAPKVKDYVHRLVYRTKCTTLSENGSVSAVRQTSRLVAKRNPANLMFC